MEARSAVLQMEFDVTRLKGMSRRRVYGYEKSQTSPYQDAIAIAYGALQDTFECTGTFVVVVGPEKITIVQRADVAEEL